MPDPKIHSTQSKPKEVHPAYKLVFLALAILTVLEVAVSYLPEGVKVPILVVLAASKALLVLLFFMHLRYDHPVFAYPIILGLVLSVPIVLIMVLVMPLLH